MITCSPLESGASGSEPPCGKRTRSENDEQEAGAGSKRANTDSREGSKAADPASARMSGCGRGGGEGAASGGGGAGPGGAGTDPSDSHKVRF